MSVTDGRQSAASLPAPPRIYDPLWRRPCTLNFVEYQIPLIIYFNCISYQPVCRVPNGPQVTFDKTDVNHLVLMVLSSAGGHCVGGGETHKLFQCVCSCVSFVSVCAANAFCVYRSLRLY